MTTDLRVPDAAAALACSVPTVYRMLRSGKLAGYRVGNGRGDWRVRQQAIEAVKRPVDPGPRHRAAVSRVPARSSSRLPGWNKFAGDRRAD